MLSTGVWLGGISEKVLCVSSRRVDIVGALDTSSRGGRILGGTLNASVWLDGILEKALCVSCRRGDIVGMLDTSSRGGRILGGTLSASVWLDGISEHPTLWSAPPTAHAKFPSVAKLTLPTLLMKLLPRKLNDFLSFPTPPDPADPILLEDPVQLNFFPLSVAVKKLFISHLVPVLMGPSLLDGVFRVILKRLRSPCLLL
jgi:hypothetical protein